MASGSGKDRDATQDPVYGPLEESTAAAAQAVPPPPAPPAEDLHERPAEGGGSLSPDTAAEEEAAAAATADRKGEKVATTPSSPSSPSRYAGSISRPAAPVDSIHAGEDSSFALAVDSRREGTVSWKGPLVGEIGAVPKVVRPIDLKNFDTLLQEEKAIKDPERRLASAEEQEKGKHKGTRFHVNVSLPIQRLERKVPLPKKVDFKNNKMLPCDPPEGLPQPAPAGPHNGEVKLTIEQYYKAGLSVLDDSISTVNDKVTLVIKDQDTSPADTKRMARKLGRGVQYLKYNKECLMDFEEFEYAQMVEGSAAAVEAEALAAAGEAQGMGAAGAGEAPGPAAAGESQGLAAADAGKAPGPAAA